MFGFSFVFHLRQFDSYLVSKRSFTNKFPIDFFAHLNYVSCFKKKQVLFVQFSFELFLVFLASLQLKYSYYKRKKIGLPGKLASDHFDSQCLQVFSMDFPFLIDLEKNYNINCRIA